MRWRIQHDLLTRDRNRNPFAELYPSLSNAFKTLWSSAMLSGMGVNLPRSHHLQCEPVGQECTLRYFVLLVSSRRG